MKYDFLAIGDIVVDNFIRLKDATVHCNIRNEECEICMRWGDKIPYEFSTEVPAVGNAANAAVAASRLGLRSALRAYVGEDEHAVKCLSSLSTDGVDAALVEKQAGKHTNYHFVLWYESERTILIKHETYEYALPALAEAPSWVYLSSLSENSLPYHADLANLFTSWPDTTLAFQPGTFQIKFGAAALKDIYARTYICFCNKEEAERILERTPGTDMKELLRGMRALGPRIAVITDDVRGACALDEAEAYWFIPRYPDPRPPYEITGAGDAFAAGTTAALALGKPLREALCWGAADASAVLQSIGAQKGLLSRKQLEEEWLAKAPADFKVAPLP